MDEKTVEQLFKSNNAALHAMVEHLEKSEARFASQDAAIEVQKQVEATELAKAQSAEDTQNIVKSITDQVVEVLQKTAWHGEKENMELNGDVMKPVSHKDVFNKEGGDEDPQVDAKDRNETNSVQKPIQAMIKAEIAAGMKEITKHFLKEHEALYGAGEDLKEDVMDEPAEEGMGIADEGMGMEEPEGDGSAEYPMEEEEYDEDTFKMLKSLQKQMTTMSENMPAEIQKQAQVIADRQMKELGFQKEQSRNPRLTHPVGLDNDDYAISKSISTGPQDAEQALTDLAKMSYGDLYNAKMQRDAAIKSGNTDGIPKEFLIQG